MTFDRPCHPSRSFGFAPTSLDTPYGDAALDGFGGRGARPDGFGLPVAVQFARADSTAGVHDVGEIAGRATEGAGGRLPHLDVIQRAFGAHDLGGVRAHTSAAAAEGAAALGARAFATGNDIAFASPTPDLHTAAHEAAHVVQQRAGVHLKNGIG